jgi:hypothetical protein
VLDAMRQKPRKVRQLGQALVDYAAGQPIRIVDEAGEVTVAENGSSLGVTDTYLREEFNAAGRPQGQRSGDSPTDRYLNGVAKLAAAMISV